MNPDQAKEVLAAWKPSAKPADDPELATALELTSQDPELKAWFESHRAFQARTRDALRGLPVPGDLAARILSRHRTPQPAVVRFPLRWLAAASVLVLLGIVGLTSLNRPPQGSDLQIVRNRVVRSVLREYRMDVVTNNLATIRQFLAQGKAPADFQLPPPLQALEPVGGGLLSWQGRPISMVCLDGREIGMMFLFILPAESLRDGPADNAIAEQVNKLGTLSWSRDGQTYILAAATSPDDLRKYL